MTIKVDLLKLADAVKSGELAMIFCHPGGLGALDATPEQRVAVETALRLAAHESATDPDGCGNSDDIDATSVFAIGDETSDAPDADVIATRRARLFGADDKRCCWQERAEKAETQIGQMRRSIEHLEWAIENFRSEIADFDEEYTNFKSRERDSLQCAANLAFAMASRGDQPVQIRDAIADLAKDSCSDV